MLHKTQNTRENIKYHLYKVCEMYALFVNTYTCKIVVYRYAWKW